MTTFKVGETVFPTERFLKHHKRASVHIGREYVDGTYEDLIKKDSFRKDVETNPDAVFTAQRRIYRNGDLEQVTDKFIWAENADYEEANIPYYSIGSSNTKQTSYLRFKFQFEDAVGYLETALHTSGSYAMPLNSYASHDFVEAMIEELLDEGATLEMDGIQRDGSEVRMYVVDKIGEPIDMSTTVHEIADGFVGFEIYKFDMTIMSDEEMNERGDFD